MSNLYALPEGWEWKKLGEITKTTSGGTPKRNEKSYWNGDIGWLKSGELNDSLITKVDEYITEEGLQKSSAKIFPVGTLLIAMYGATVGKLGILDIETTTNQAICAVLNDKNLFETKFIFYFLKNIRKKMLIDSIGGAQPNLSQTYIKNIDIPLPPLQEQKRIVAKLDSLFGKIDQAIALHQQNIDEADALMGSMLNEVFGELEGRYEKDKLDNLTSLITKGTTPTTNGYEFQDQGINFLKIENIVNGRIDLSTIETFISEEAHQSQKRSQLEVNDVLFSIAGTIGDTAIVKEKHLPMNTNQAIALIRPIEKLNPEFLRRLLSSSLSNQTTSKKRGGAIKNVSLGDIKNTIIPVPPLKTQQKTVQYLDRLSQQAERLKQVQQEKMQHLKDLKASILDRAFRGEI